MGPIGAIDLDTRDTIKAFLDYFDELEEEGWLYVGMVTYPDLPYGGCYVFRKDDTTPKTPLIQVKTVDEQPIGEEILIDPKKQDEILDMYNEEKKLTDEEKRDLMDAPNSVANEIIFRQQRVMNGENEDPDKTSNLVDELVRGAELETPKEDTPKEKVRMDLYKQYEKENPNKHAVYRGKETNQFRDWLDEQKAEYDPTYQEYKQETGKNALKDEQETEEFKDWFFKRFPDR